MVTPKVTKPAKPNVASRQRGHTLAPEHLGEQGAAATLISAIGGMAIFITAVAMTIGGLRLPGTYAGAQPPPNIDQLALRQVLAGIALLALGLLVVAATVALLANLPRSRPLAIGASGLAALLAAAAFVLVVAGTRGDPTLLIALGVAVVAFGGSSLVLARRRP